MKKLKNNEAMDEVVNLSRLPDDLLISILSKLNDLKDICVCSLVCKHFASTVTRIQTISLKFPVREIRYEDRFVAPLPIEYKSSITFLKKLTKLESLDLEFTCPRNASGSQCLKWKAKCERNRARLASFICLLPNSVQRTIQNQHEEEPENREDHFYSNSFSLGFNRSGFNNIFKVLCSCSDCMRLLPIVIGHLCSLKRVTITDSEKHGEVIVEDEQLVMWRNSLVSQEGLNLDLKRFIKKDFLPVVHLPSSGYVMKRVQALIVFLAESEEVGKKDMMSWKYEGEEKILGEAVEVILPNTRMVPFAVY